MRIACFSLEDINLTSYYRDSLPSNLGNTISHGEPRIHINTNRTPNSFARFRRRTSSSHLYDNPKYICILHYRSPASLSSFLQERNYNPQSCKNLSGSWISSSTPGQANGKRIPILGVTQPFPSHKKAYEWNWGNTLIVDVEDHMWRCHNRDCNSSQWQIQNLTGWLEKIKPVLEEDMEYVRPILQTRFEASKNVWKKK